MYHFYSDDGRILTPPQELAPQLKGAFPAFSKLLGHIRFFFMADEIWDGTSSLIFRTDGKQWTSVTLDDGAFCLHIADKDFRIVDESLLDHVFGMLKDAMPADWHRPFEQLTVNPAPDAFPCGYRCDLCLGQKSYNEKDDMKCDNFAYMNWVCYHHCVPGIDIERPAADDSGVFRCSGCNQDRNEFCQSFSCSKEKGYAHCAACGSYRSCDIHRGNLYAGQCNLGITAEEVTKLVIPYCMQERLDILAEQQGGRKL